MRRTPTCHPDKPYGANGLCHNCYNKQWSAKHPEKAKEYRRRDYVKRKNRARNLAWQKISGARRGISYKYRLKSRFGITPEDVQKMYEAQHGLCVICRRSAPLGVDHNHKTGKVRGLLCHGCNAALGLFQENKESLKAAIVYLEAHNEDIIG